VQILLLVLYRVLVVAVPTEQVLDLIIQIKHYVPKKFMDAKHVCLLLIQVAMKNVLIIVT
jgi:hypothetical protein